MNRHLGKLLVASLAGLLLVLFASGVVALDPAPTFVLKWGFYGTAPGRLIHPHGVAVDADGMVYVADKWNGRIQKFDANGDFRSSWTGSTANMIPVGITVSVGSEVYVADGTRRVQVFSLGGTFLRSWGSFGGDPGQFDHPWDIAVDDSEHVYVTDLYTNRVQKFTKDGQYITRWLLPDEITPYGVAAFGGHVFVSSITHMWKYRTDGTLVQDWSGGGVFLSTDGLGNLYATGWNNRAAKYSAAGVLLTVWGTSGSGDGQFSAPTGIAADGRGSVYVAEGLECGGPPCGNHRVQKFSDIVTSTLPSTWGSVKARYR